VNLHKHRLFGCYFDAVIEDPIETSSVKGEKLAFRPETSNLEQQPQAG
jgi:hypothetical protein